MQSIMNLKIKFRESFRPFAPAVRRDRTADYFDMRASDESPYMLIVAPIREEIRTPLGPDDEASFGMEKLNCRRSTIPAVTHVDYSARVQTVDPARNPRFHKLLVAFEAKTGCAVLINTSFNVRGEPIVCTPEDAYRCFRATKMDALALGRCLLMREEQSAASDDEAAAHLAKFALD